MKKKLITFVVETMDDNDFCAIEDLLQARHLLYMFAPESITYGFRTLDEFESFLNAKKYN